MFLKIDGIVALITRWISYISAACLIGIMVVAFFNVLGEKLFHWGIPASTEIIQYLHIPVVFLACAFVTMDRGQIRIDLLFDRFPKPMRAALGIMGDVLGAFICVFIAVRGFVQTDKFIERHAMSSISGIGFPLAPFGFILWFGFALFAFAFVWCLLRKLSRTYREAHVGNNTGGAPDGQDGEVMC
jgi:TRAP-type C4-dicarboxylate transport system permease small subunit